jgi:hypothetical protein
MDDTSKKLDQRRVLPSQRCPKCSSYVDRRELQANGGACNLCSLSCNVAIGIRTDGTTNTGFEVTSVHIY